MIGRLIACNVAREIEQRARDFYECVLPPVDIVRDGDTIQVMIDLPGFAKEEIRLTIRRNILSVRAARTDGERSGDVICRQRPAELNRRIRLPAHVREGEESVKLARYENGVLTVVVLVPRRGQDVTIE